MSTGQRWTGSTNARTRRHIEEILLQRVHRKDVTRFSQAQDACSPNQASRVAAYTAHEHSEAAVMVNTDTVPIIYFDTTVLLDMADRRSESTLTILDIVCEQQFRVLASPFGILEMIEAKKTDRWAESMLERGFTVLQISRRMGSRRSGPTALTSEQLAQVYT